MYDICYTYADNEDYVYVDSVDSFADVLNWLENYLTNLEIDSYKWFDSVWCGMRELDGKTLFDFVKNL